jgi:hypothetical protein
MVRRRDFLGEQEEVYIPEDDTELFFAIESRISLSNPIEGQARL